MEALELGSGIVTPPWMPLAVAALLLVVLGLLFWSMQRRIGRIQVPREDEKPDAAESPTTP